MKGGPFKQHRRSIRLRGYDYSQQGAYFITIVTRNRECLFGNIVDGAVQWSPIGQTAHDYWYEIPHHFTNAELDEFVVMPNHVHGIIVIADPPDDVVGAQYIEPYHIILSLYIILSPYIDNTNINASSPNPSVQSFARINPP